MQKILYYICLLLFFLNCNTSKEISIDFVNGYWEIDNVVTLDGLEKPYKFNAFVDYFNIKNDSTGFRKKLKPSFKGVYKGNNILQSFKVIKRGNAIFFHYKNQYASWEEQLIEASSNRIIFQSKEKVNYIYKPFTPITIE